MNSTARTWIGTTVLLLFLLMNRRTATAASGTLTVRVSPVAFEGTFFALAKTNTVSLSGSNTIPGSTRVTVNGSDAAFDTNTAIWSMPESLAPGFNRLVIQARDVSGVVLAETNRDVVLQLASSPVAGTLSGNTVWGGSLAILHVTGNVLVPEGGTLTVEEGTVLLLDAGASIRATNASITVQGTARKPVRFLPSDGASVWGGIIPVGVNASLWLQHAEMIAGHVEILNGATGILEDSILRDYTGNTPSIVSTFKPALLAMRRCHVARYFEVLSQMGLNQIEDCLFEYPLGDAIDFDAGKPGSFIRDCTIRHGAAVNVDAIDLGYASDLSPTVGVTIEGCLIHDFPLDKGVSIGEAAANVIVRNCVIFNVATAIAVKDSSFATLHNNTLADASVGLHLYQKGVTPGGGHGVAFNNILWGLETNILLDALSTLSISNSDVDGAGIYPGAGNLNSNPLFLNATQHDYRLATNSPCLDAGTNGTTIGAIFPVGSSLVDTDDDGMPDRWEMTYGFDFNNAADAALDADGDGPGNQAEWVAGTDPTNPASLFKLSAGGFSSNGIVLQFLAVTGRDYTLQFRTNLSAGAWEKLLDIPAPPSSTVVSVTDTNAEGSAGRFYRLMTPAQP